MSSHGRSTNARRCARGWGNVNSGSVEKTGPPTELVTVITSTSSVRGPYRRSRVPSPPAPPSRTPAPARQTPARAVSRDPVDIQRPRPVPAAGVPSPARRLFQYPGPGQPILRAGRVVVDQQGGVEEGRLLVVAPRRGLVHPASDQQHAGQGLDGTAEVPEPVAQVAAEREDGPGHRVPLVFRTVTATSVNSCGIGAPGLCTVTVAAPTRSSVRQATASRSASVSMRLTGSPATIFTSFSANSP